MAKDKAWERPYYKTHEQVAFWLPKPTAQAFKDACEREGKTIRDVLGEAVEIMVASAQNGKAAAEVRS